MKYRIKEFNGIYTIQLRIEKVTGILWFKKTITKWVICNTLGYQYRLNSQVQIIAKYGTLEEAKRVMNAFKKGKEYHY